MPVCLRGKNDMVKALGPTGLKRAAPVTSSQQGADENLSELAVVHAHDLPGPWRQDLMEARPARVGWCNYGV